MLKQLKFNMDLDCVHETWNRFENELIVVIDEIVPNVPHITETIIDSYKDKKLKN